MSTFAVLNVKKSNFARIKNQLFASLTANILVFSQLLCVGWWSPTLLLYRSADSPLKSGYISIEDASWIGSTLSFGSTTGVLFYGLLSKYVGNKTTLAFSGWPVIVSWILVMFATNPYHLYVARFFAGVTGGSFLSQLPLYIAEIADKEVRGSLGSILTISMNTGMLLGFIIGSYVPYKYQPIVGLLFPILFNILFFRFPNTPQFLLKAGKVEAAKKSLTFYRNCDPTSKEEVEQIRIEFQIFKDIEKQRREAERLQFTDFTKLSSLKVLTVGPILMAITQFTGVFTIMNYAGTIFKESGSTIDPNISSIILGLVQIFGSFCCIAVIDKVGRKILLAISTLGCSIGLFVMGCYSYMSKHDFDICSLNLVPIMSLSFVTFISSIGLTPVPFIIVAEILSLKLRRCGVIITITMMCIFGSVELKLFPILMSSIELYGCMWLSASVSLLGLIFVIIVVKETKGTNLNVM